MIRLILWQESAPLLNYTQEEHARKSDMVDSDSDQAKTKRSVRNTWVRWVMLAFGSLFLMGSYFCYDNVSMDASTLENPPYEFKQVQVNSLYSIYSLPNTVLPLMGGILLDITGIR